jgi:hypothetical protein
VQPIPSCGCLASIEVFKLLELILLELILLELILLKLIGIL